MTSKGMGNYVQALPGETSCDHDEGPFLCRKLHQGSKTLHRPRPKAKGGYSWKVISSNEGYKFK